MSAPFRSASSTSCSYCKTSADTLLYGPDLAQLHPSAILSLTKSQEKRELTVNRPADTTATDYTTVPARTPVELRDVFCLRYDIYCRELEWEDTSPADAGASNAIKDDLDDHSFVFQSRHCGKLVGTIRLTVLSASLLAQLKQSDFFQSYAQMYGFNDDHSLLTGTVCLATRLMFRAEHRSFAGFLGLFNDLHSFLHENGIRHVLADTIVEDFPIFARLGFRVRNDNVMHPYYGHTSVVMQYSVPNPQ